MKSIPIACLLAAFLAVAPNGWSQFNITGVGDKDYNNHANSATFTVHAEPGYSYRAMLDEDKIPTDLAITVNQVDYHELNVWATNLANGEVQSQLTRFIVHSSERGNSENGLPPWTYYPTIPSAAAEFAGAQVRVITPADFPIGYPIPVVAWVNNPDGHARRANGQLTAPGHPAIKIKRGVGSGFLAADHPAGSLAYAPQIGGLSASKTINLENSTAWEFAFGTLGANTVWPENSRKHVTSTLTVPAGGTLTIGAGTIVRVNTSVDIVNNGTILINGTPDRPVVFLPTTTGEAWGGFIQHANNASFTATGAIFSGSGYRDCWFKGHECSSGLYNIGSHRGQQALISLKGANCNLTMTDCAAIYSAGQFGHSASGSGNSYTITLTRTLVQRGITGGEYTGALFHVNDCAFMEFDDDLTVDESADFVDGDNDGLYIVNAPSGQSHGFTNTLFGWTKDDGIDSGGSGSGALTYQNCWFESITHEANSLSGTGKDVNHYRSVFLNCGQGLESGYNGPSGWLHECLATDNLVGGRFGDNYDWSYSGFFGSEDSILIHNHRDVWGWDWDDWQYRAGDMDVRNNLLTAANPRHPDNAVWNPDLDAWRLTNFLTIPLDASVGVGLATWAGQFSMNAIFDGAPVRLSSFSTNWVSVDYLFEDVDDAPLAAGTLMFAPGETLKRIYPAGFNVPDYNVVRLALTGATNGELTGATNVTFQGSVPAPTVSCWISGNQVNLARLGEGVAVKLSRPAAQPVTVDYAFAGTGGPLVAGTLTFDPGQTVQWIDAPGINPDNHGLVRFNLSHPAQAQLSGVTTVYFVKTALPPAVGGTTLIAKGASWRYRDAASAAPAGWQNLGFSDAGWPSGPTQLGFGDNDEAHKIADNNQITSYFRHGFVVADPAAFSGLSMWLLRDDGAVVYLNGTEVFRSSNLPAFPAAITYSQLAGNQGDNVVDTASLSTAALRSGNNVAAVEVHQQSATSSDVSFNFELIGEPVSATVPQYVYAGEFGGQLVVAWGDATFALEEADDLAGPWRPAASSSPLLAAPTAGQKFYRLRKP